MEVMFDRVAGLDVGKESVTVCVRTPGPRGGRRSETRTFKTMTGSLRVMRDWLVEAGVSIAAMESTSAYWKPPFYCLEEVMEVWLLNAAHMKAVPGRKSDVRDAEWIAQLLEHGLLAPSFVPPPEIRRLRMLTRYRVQLMGDRTREIVRLELMLEDASDQVVLGGVESEDGVGPGDADRDDQRRIGSVAARRYGEGQDAAQDPRSGAGVDRTLRRQPCPAGPLDAASAGSGRAGPGRAGRGDRRRLPAVAASDRAAANHSRRRAEGRAGDHRRDRRATCPVPDRRASGRLGRVGAGDARVRRQTDARPGSGTATNG